MFGPHDPNVLFEFQRMTDGTDYHGVCIEQRAYTAMQRVVAAARAVQTARLRPFAPSPQLAPRDDVLKLSEALDDLHDALDAYDRTQP